MISTLRICLDGKWTASDFTKLFEATDALHNLLAQLAARAEDPKISAAINDLTEGADSSETTALLDQLAPSLRVIQIRFASPGNLDIAGIGSAIQHISDFIKWLIEFSAPSSRIGRSLLNEEKALLNEVKRQEVVKARMENLTSLLSLSKAAGCGKEETQRILRSALSAEFDLCNLVERGQITDAVLLGHQNGDNLKSRPAAASAS